MNMKLRGLFVILAWNGVATLGALTPAAELPRAVSTASLTNRSGAGGSFAPSFSADGRFLVFLSQANNLVTNDDLEPHVDVFRHDLTSTNTALVSVNTSGQGGGDDDSAFPSISGDGRYVVFSSAAGNLVNTDTNRLTDVFVRDMDSGITRLVSVNAAGTEAGNNPSRLPQISPDGRYVVFESTASDLVTNDTNGSSDIFLRDLQADTTWLISANAGGTASAAGQSESPAISSAGPSDPPGTLAVAFISTATDLVPTATTGYAEVYVRSWPSGTIRWASSNVASHFEGLTNGYRCFNPALSADGTVVAFKASSPGDRRVLVFRHDLGTGITTSLTSNSLAESWPVLSADGRYLAYESGPVPGNTGTRNVFVWDALLATNLLVSMDPSGTGPASGVSQTPAMTPEGSKVCFLSTATNWAANVPSGFFQLYLRDLVAGTTRLVSLNRTNAASADLSAVVPSMSADGRWVAFDSTDGNLVADDFNQASDVFLRDLDTETTRLVSTAHGASPSRTPPRACSAAPNVHSSDGLSREPSSMAAYAVSADGRFVVFSGWNNNWTPGDTNRWQDIFVRDVVTGDVKAVSSEVGGAGERSFWQAALSGDGRYVVFAGRTNANASSIMSSPLGALYWRDLQRETNCWIAAGLDGETYRDFYPFSISRDGQLIAFQTRSDLGPNYSEVFLRDVSAATNQWLSSDQLSGLGFNPLISPDGRWVAFASGSPSTPPVSLLAYDRTLDTNRVISLNADGALVYYKRGAVFSGDSHCLAFVASTWPSSADRAIYLRNLITESTIQVCTNCDNPSLAADRRLVVFEALLSSIPRLRDIVLEDLQTGATNLISRNLTGTGGGNGHSTSPFLSADGRYVVFASMASDLVPNDTNNAGDIFVRDLLLNTTLLVSMNRFGTGPGNGHSTRPVLGADGRTVLFLSYASDLVDGDFNNQRDVFVLRLAGTDSDQDGLDDEWEVAYFGDLSHDGSADSDQDGLTDRQEFLAGTDPTNQGSVLRVLRLTSANGGSTTLLWSAVPGRSYRVQYKDSLSAPAWRQFRTPVTATTTTAVFTDDSPSAFEQRFYRVTVSP